MMLADLVWAGMAYGSAFSLRVYLPFPLTADFLPASRFTEVAHPLLLLLGTQVALPLFLRPVRPAGAAPARPSWRRGWRRPSASNCWPPRPGISFGATCPSRARCWSVFWLFNTLGVIGVRLWVNHRLGHSSPVRVILIGLARDVRMFLSSLTDLHPSPGLDVVGAIGLEESACRTPEEVGVPWAGQDRRSAPGP